MNILIAPDSFKDCLSAKKVGEAMRKGIMAVPGKWNIRMVPMADGGEGTLEALVDATNGTYINTEAYDPLLRLIQVKYGILGDGNTAVIEMAAVSGIELLKPEERNPWITSSIGTGQLVKEALDKGCKRIIVGIGGSATNDAGVGLAEALGIRFLDRNGRPVGYGGGKLSEISRIETQEFDRRLKKCEIYIACDVTNTLTGPQGASMVYASQKGAGREMVKQLDANLAYFAGLVKSQLNREIDIIPGAGAAGGLGAGFLAFTPAVLQPGFEIVRHETRLDEHIHWADIVITGEGKIDFQTQFGKTPMGVAGAAKKSGKPVIAIAGTLGEGYQELYTLGFDAIFSIIDKPMTLNEALILSPELIERFSNSLIRLLTI